MRSRLHLIATLLIFTFLAPGCGEEGGDTGSVAVQTEANGNPEAGPANAQAGQHAQFVKRANLACEKTSGQLTAMILPYFQKEKRQSGSREARVTDFIETAVAPGFEAQIRAIRGLDPPTPTERDRVEAILDEVDRVLDEARQDPLGFIENSEPFAKAEKLADRDGLTACARV